MNNHHPSPCHECIVETINTNTGAIYAKSDPMSEHDAIVHAGNLFFTMDMFAYQHNITWIKQLKPCIQAGVT